MISIRSWKMKLVLSITAIIILISLAVIVLPKILASLEKVDINLKEEFVFPELTGSFQVGRTTAYLVDKDRPALPGLDGPREFVVTIFYPAIPEALATPGPYAEDGLKTAYALQSLTKRSADALDLIHAHAYRNAAADPSAGKYPVLLFSPGGGEQPLFYTALLEQISSYGYIVVAVPEPFDSPVIPLPDGRVLTSAQAKEWCELDSVCQKAIKGDETALRQIENTMKDDRAKDMIFTLNSLETINREDPILAGTMNLDKVGAFGHSFGGASAVRIAQLDERIDIVSILDSDIFLVIPEGSPPLSIPVIYMSAANIDVTQQELEEISNIDALTTAYLRRNSPHYFINIAGTTHQSFQSDVMLLAPYISIAGQRITINSSDTNPARILDIIAAYNVAFFDQYLKGIEQPLLSGYSDAYPEITFTAEQ